MRASCSRLACDRWHQPFVIQVPSGFLSFSTMPGRFQVDPVHPRSKNDFRSPVDAQEGALIVSLESLHRLIGALISKDVDLRGSCDRWIRTICKEPSDIAVSLLSLTSETLRIQSPFPAFLEECSDRRTNQVSKLCPLQYTQKALFS